MCIKTSNRLKKYGLYAKTISIQLKDTSFKQITRSQTVQVPIQSVNELYPIIEELFDEHWEGASPALNWSEYDEFSQYE